MPVRRRPKFKRMKLAKVPGPRRRATPLGRVLGCSVWGEPGGTRTDEPEPITCARLCKTAHIARFLQTAHAGFFFMKNLHPSLSAARFWA
jgi:hypothetical protein